MEIIAELEPDQRGPYGGAVGYFDFDGDLETAITIRTLVLRTAWPTSRPARGIVADSDPPTEYQETLNKAKRRWLRSPRPSAWRARADAGKLEVVAERACCC